MSSSLVDHQERRIRLAGKLLPSAVCMLEILSEILSEILLEILSGLLVLSMVLSIPNLSGSSSGLFDSHRGSKLRFVRAIKLPRGLL